MNLLSVNCRGIGEAYKVDWIRRLKSKHMVSFLAIQETQIIEAENIDVRGCWGADNFGSSKVNSTGRSGGLLNVWDDNLFQITEVISSRHFLINIGHWSGVSELLIFANVYEP